MWLTVMAMLLAAQPDPDSAEAVFKRMEQPILKCKTFKADVEIAASDKTYILKGRLLIAEGNKMRLELHGSARGEAAKHVEVSDGTKMRITEGAGPGEDQEPPKELKEGALAMLTRSGFWVPNYVTVAPPEPGEKPKPFDLDKELAVSEIKLGKREALFRKETQPLHYKLTRKGGGKEPLAMTVWIDVKTNLPVKRVVTFKGGTETLTITETYTKAALDEKIDAKVFELSK